MTKRVLFLFPLARYMYAHWSARIMAAERAGYDVHVGVPFDADLEGMMLGRVTMYDLPLRRGLPSVFAELNLIYAGWRLLRHVKPDLLHAVTLRPVAYGGVLARLLGVPAAVYSLTGLGFLYASDGSLARVLRPMVERALSFAFAPDNLRVLFENPDDRTLLVERGVLTSTKSSVFIGGGLDLQVFAHAPAPDDDIPLITLPSRLIVPKGVHEFVAAARLLKSEGVKARFALVGESDVGNPDSIALSTFEGWAREGVVEYWGWRDDMVAVLRASAIVCLPTWYREGAPRILIEAAAIGRPVVTTDWPGCRDVVVAGATGILVPPRDSGALADALRTLIADPALRQSMGIAARKHAEAHFSNELAEAHMLALYADLL